MSFKSFLGKIFNKELLAKLIEPLSAYADGLEYTNEGKKKYVIDAVIAIQQEKFNIKLIPDSVEVWALNYILNDLVDVVWALIKKSVRENNT